MCGCNKGKGYSNSEGLFMQNTENELIVEYIGSLGSVTYQGNVTKRNYKFTIQKPFVLVAKEDIAGLLSIEKRNKRQFQLVIIQEIVEEVVNEVVVENIEPTVESVVVEIDENSPLVTQTEEVVEDVEQPKPKRRNK